MPECRHFKKKKLHGVPSAGAFIKKNQKGCAWVMEKKGVGETGHRKGCMGDGEKGEQGIENAAFKKRGYVIDKGGVVF